MIGVDQSYRTARRVAIAGIGVSGLLACSNVIIGILAHSTSVTATGFEFAGDDMHRRPENNPDREYAEASGVPTEFRARTCLWRDCVAHQGARRTLPREPSRLVDRDGRVR
jgi:hypothetical protein